MKIKNIKINYINEPIGITEIPEINWQIESDENNFIQEYYYITVGNKDFSEKYFDTGKIESDKSAHIFVDFPMESLKKYYVKLKIGKGDNEFEKTTFFITGILNNEELCGDFITIDNDKDKMCGYYLKKKVNIEKEIVEAYSVTTALGIYKFYINNKKIGDFELAPGWTSYHNRLLYQVCDITNSLKQGENTLCSHIGAGWYKGTMGFKHHKNTYGDYCGVYNYILITYKDGTKDIICTDENWEGSTSPVVFSEIYDGEIYDARLEDNLNWETARKLNFNKKILVAQPSCYVKEHEEFKGKIIKTPKGETVIDFGQNLAGWVKLFISNTKYGDEIEYCHFESLDKDGNVYLDNLRKAKQKIKYICRDGENIEYRPNFTFQGFRYVQILNFPYEINKNTFTSVAVYSDMKETGEFKCSNDLINKFNENIGWGLRSNFVDVPTDCPQRDERLGWTGDAQIFCRTATFLRDTFIFFDKWLDDVMADQTEDGGVPHVVPDILSMTDMTDDWLLSQGTHSAAAWADVISINPWNLYLAYGDERILKKYFNAVIKWISFMENNSKNYIWNYKVQFGDWVALDAEEGSYFGATPNDLTCTAYFAYTTNIAIKMAKVLGENNKTKRLEELYKNIVVSFRNSFYTKNGDMVEIAQTQTSHILALHFNLVEEKFKEKTINRLVELLEKENNHLVTGFVGTPYFCHALSNNGKVDKAYELLLQEDFPSWLYQVKMGATTVWEHWDGIKPDGSMWSADMNSFNHYAYGAIGEWLYRVVLGIEIDEENPGYKHFYIKPKFGNKLDFAKGSYESIYGEIKVHWKRNGENIDLTFEIPANTSATLRIENLKEKTYGSGKYNIQIKL
ncbi:MAG: family 78 glycoside hydrolase catalytic domain [Lachnospirales bacterium]